MGDPRDTDAGRGPTYWDVEKLLTTAQAGWPGTFVFETTGHLDRERMRYHWYVCAKYFPVGARLGQAPIGNGYGFRGNGGAATMPAAMYHALLGLLEKLEDRSSEKAQQSMF